MVKIKPIKVTNGQDYEEPVIQGRMGFCFISEGFEQASRFTGCREGVAAHLINKLQKPKTSKVSLEKTRIAIQDSTNPDLDKDIPKILDWLHQVEKKFGLVRTVAEETKGLEKFGKVFYIEGSSRWLLAPPMLSIYLYGIRNGRFHTEGDKYSSVFAKVKSIGVLRDETFALHANEGVEFIAREKYWKVFGKDINKNWLGSTSVSTFMGVEQFVTAKQPNAIFSHWKFPCTIMKEEGK